MDELFKREELSLINQRNYRKFLKALRTESPIQVLTNVVKRIFRTLLKSYKRTQLHHTKDRPTILWILPNTPAKD